jgi:hypothetical protein
MTKHIQNGVKGLFLGTALVAAATISIPRPAQADTTSTVLIAAGAAAIVGALLLDSNNQPYYVNNNHRYYVTQDEANYYRSHNNVVVRQAYVPQSWSSYPVARNAGYRTTQPQHSNNQGNNGYHNGNTTNNYENGR